MASHSRTLGQQYTTNSDDAPIASSPRKSARALPEIAIRTEAWFVADAEQKSDAA